MNRFTQSFTEADKAFNGQYQRELQQLKELSKEEIASILQNTTQTDVYEKLIKIIEDASKNNMKQAELISKIKTLGDGAIKLAKKISGLDSFF